MVADSLGHLFEVGFNIGILAYIEQHQIKHHFGKLYRRDLQRLKFSEMLKKILGKEDVISQGNIRIIEKWSLFLIQKGFLSGLNFFDEYIKSTEWHKHNYRHLEILYYQCSFCGENSIKTYDKSEKREYKELLSQFGDAINQDSLDRYIDKYKHKGEFLKSDTLMLLRYRQEYRILVVDLSIFSVKSAKDLLDLEDENLQNQRRLLNREISYLKSKSVFSKLRIDTGATEDLGFAFSENLTRYFTAFKREDKESAKLIQAASYAYSFYGFLREAGIFTDKTSVVFNVVGFSDRHLNTLSLRPENLGVLATCSQIYKNEPKEQDINQARRQVLEQIKRNASRCFADGKKFVNRLLDIPGDTTTVVSHTERIDGFSSTLELRQPHNELIKKALVSEQTYIFLTGNPGIGKTTAIVEFLKAHINEGFLFFYVSPRKQVNLDIIEKFKNPETEQLCHDSLFCINTNSQLIDDHFPHCVVNYSSNQFQDDFTLNRITFLNGNLSTQRPLSHQKALKRESENQIVSTSHKSQGVLSTLCEAIYTVINQEVSNNLVATTCIQSLKISSNGANTLTNFEKIFKDACNKREGKIIPEEMRKISQRIKHLFIMIDEITGDDSGVGFFTEISRILNRYELTDLRHGFNTKVIVADASIVDKDVIKQHLSETSPEPDKIFFRRVSSQAALDISVEEFQFNKWSKSTVINANSYPASSLTITYKVFVESIKFDEDKLARQNDNLKNTIQTQIVEDINRLYKQPDAGQILVYIQDKRRLQELIEKLKQQRGEFEKNQDYLEVHASLSDNEKPEIARYKNQVKVVFMTSSASRGLSFPKAKHILVEIPRFRVESNLMEVIQVIYRGRGGYDEDGVSETLDDKAKELMFYLGDRAIYYTDDKDLSLQESILNLLNILLILKTCIMTRIKGAGQLGREWCLMIPIGGKSVSAAGQTFSGQMAHLIKSLKSEYHRRPSYKLLQEVYTSLESLLSRAEFILTKPEAPKNRVKEAYSYLDIPPIFNSQFSRSLAEGFDKLLEFGNLEPGHITGSLLVVPIANQRLEETYEMRLVEIATNASDELLNKMLSIHLSSDYPSTLRSAVKKAIELIEKVRECNDKTQFFQQKSQHLDQYYAVPLFTFISGEVMSNYFANAPEESEDERFRDILATYIHHLYPADKTLPIGYKYKSFPFVVFRSYSLEEMREKIFTDKYLLTSNELNVLNLILSRPE